MSASSTNTRRPHPARRDFASSTTAEGSQPRSRRPPRHPGPGNHVTTDNRTRPGKPKPRPTHFLALPIGHHAALRSTISALTSSWLAHEPPIDGLDPSIVVHPRRLHLTLGAVALAPPNNNNNRHRHRDREQGSEPQPGLDLAGATRLLASLAPGIRALLEHGPLRIPLGRLAVMQPDPARAHVLYVEPDLRSPEGRRLRAVCDLVHGAFKEAGFLTDGHRPLKLHCTILNTTYRRAPAGQRRPTERTPFSFAAFPQQSSAGAGSDLGSWTVDELQICEMGSWAPDGAYVRVAGCDLRPES